VSDATEPGRGDILDTAEAGGRAIRGGSLRVAGYVAGAAVTLLSVPLLVRHLGVVDFGRYSTVVSLIAIVAGVTEAGLGSVAVREYAVLEGSRRDQFMRDVLGARVVLTGIGVLGGIAFAAVAGYGSDLVLGAALAGVGLMVGVVQGTYLVPLSAGLRLGLVTVTDFLRTLLTAALVVALVLAGAGIVSFLAVPLPAAAVLTVVTILLVRGRVPLVPAFHPARWVPLIRETLALAVATALGTLYFRMAMLVMSLLGAAVETGYFATSYRLVEALVAIPVLLVSVTFPVLSRAARDDRERLRYAAQRIFDVGLLAGALMALVTALSAGFAIQLIGGDEAAPATPVLHLQALFLVPLFLNLTFQTLLLTLRMHREMLVSALIALVAVLALTVVLIPAMEARGAAIAVVVGETLLAAVEAAMLWRAHPDLRPKLGVVPRVAAAAGLALAAALALDAHDLVRAAVAGVVYLAVLAVLRAIPMEVIRALAGRSP
jgi:O-antigen/teichoic acid export membrane protein